MWDIGVIQVVSLSLPRCPGKDELDSLLREPSMLGGRREGVVIKNYEDVALLGGIPHELFVKYVNPEFKEAHKICSNQGDPIEEAIVKAVYNEARLRKGISRLKEERRFNNGPQDIGPLIGIVNQDIHQEAQEEIKQALFDKVWQIYQQENATDFTIKMEEFKQWADANIEKKTVSEQINKMYSKTSLFTQSYQRKNALRTSNMIDRPMKVLDRFLFCHQYFHGHLAYAQWMIRAFALVYNFVPFAPRTRKDNPNYFTSRMANINGFQYKENWLDNLMVAASCNGKLVPHQIS